VDYDSGGSVAKRAAIWQNVVSRVAALPGVEAAGISDNLPMSRNRGWGISAKGEEQRQQAPSVGVFVYIISPGYLESMGMRLLRGRDITWDDLVTNQKVVIINQTVAQRLWPGRDPIGRIAITGDTDVRVIGVIADVRESGAEDNTGNQEYLPATAQFGPDGANLVVRAKLSPSALASSVMSVLRQINPGQPATEFKPIQSLVDHATSPRRFFTLLVGIFAGLGLMLAALGIYGVIAYSVARRTQEIGIRMALGASRGRVQRSVLARTMILVAIGLVAGSALSFGVSRAIASLLFGTEPNDALTYAAMVTLLIFVALVAGYWPARRASRVDPMIALRAN